jgi:predicted enzyme related to lactoylglutathione lyase
MNHPDLIILYVDNPVNAARFYSGLLEIEPIQSSPTFMLFSFASGFRLGLWSKHTVKPKSKALAGACELSIPVTENDTVDQIHDDWQKKGIDILQPPTLLDFGYTFVAMCPDGHRLRIYALCK